MSVPLLLPMPGDERPAKISLGSAVGEVAALCGAFDWLVTVDPRAARRTVTG